MGRDGRDGVDGGAGADGDHARRGPATMATDMDGDAMDGATGMDGGAGADGDHARREPATMAMAWTAFCSLPFPTTTPFCSCIACRSRLCFAAALPAVAAAVLQPGGQ